MQIFCPPSIPEGTMDVKHLAEHGLLSDLFSGDLHGSPIKHPIGQKYSEYAHSDEEVDAFEKDTQYGQWSAEGDNLEQQTSSSYMCRYDDMDEADSISSSLVSQSQDVTSELLNTKLKKKSGSSKTGRTSNTNTTTIYSGAQLLVDESFGGAFVF